MPGTPATSPVFGAPRYNDADPATYSEQTNSVTDVFDALAARKDDPRLTDQRVPPDGSVTTAKLAPNAVTTAKVGVNQITEAQIAPQAVGTPELMDQAVTTGKLADGAVALGKIAAAAVSTGALGDGIVTLAKLAAAIQQGLPQPGDLKHSAGPATPGWLIADGSAIDRGVYAALYAALGGAASPHGQGDGATTFNLPDYRGRGLIGAGAGAGLTARVVGGKGGEETHTNTTAEMASHAHGVADPTHAHGLYDPGHAHGVSDPGHQHSVGNLSNDQSATLDIWKAGDGHGAFTSPGTGAQGTDFRGTGIGIAGAGTGQSVYAAGTGVAVQAAGGGAAHNNMQPYGVANILIKT